MAGTLYCFNTVENADIYKVGYTQQELCIRLRGYLGPSKPRVMVVSRKVDDAVQAEAIMLQLLRHSNILRPRDDLGNEWFHACLPDVDARHRTICWLAGVVQSAVEAKAGVQQSHTSRAIPPVAPLVISGGDLPGMEAYFREFDRYVAAGTIGANMTETVRGYEESEVCPIYPDFTRFSFEQRVQAASQRHPLLLS